MEVIFTYTAEQAIEDGILCHPYPERWPSLLITASIHEVCARESEEGERTYEQCLVPLLQDCIMQVQKNPNQEWPVALRHTIANTVWVCPNEKGGMTVMLPSDY